jgi:hypothetical protein
VVLNSTSSLATLNIYDFLGKLQLIQTVDPGYNEVYFGAEGAFIIYVGGTGTSNTTRIFTH